MNKNKSDIYDINDYTEGELYEILDLVNPSDRELEAKILMLIHKYENLDTRSSRKLVKFFNDVYDYFFEDSDAVDSDIEENDEEEIIEGLTNLNEKKNSKKSSVSQKKEEEGKEEIVLTKPLEVSKGVLNPLLEQTTKRVISIDSQYRVDKRTMTTEFTFNLSETLSNVISLSLSSYQIPYTWWTIGKAYGNNFFLLKGRTAGIHRSTHDIQMEIPAGNYSPINLVKAVNDSINILKSSNIDLSMGSTDLSYNPFTSLTHMNVDVNKGYTESSFYLEFPTWSSPYYFEDTSRNETIPGFLGFNTSKQYTNRIKGTEYYDSIINDNYDDAAGTTQFILDATNSKFSVSAGKDINNTFIEDLSFDISLTLTPGTYTRKEITDNLNTVLSSHSLLINSGINRLNIDPSNNFLATSPGSNNELSFYLNRNIKSNMYTKDTKIILNFVDEISNVSKIWVGSGSCFGFEQRVNYMNTIYSDIRTVAQSDIFTIDPIDQTTGNITASGQMPYVDIKPNSTYFNSDVNSDMTLNDISFSMSKDQSYLFTGTDNQYKIDGYLNALNRGIRDADAIVSTNTGIMNAPSSSYVYDQVSNQDPSGTYCFVDISNVFNLFLDIEKNFDRTKHIVDLTNGILNDTDYFQFNQVTTPNPNNPIITDLTQTLTAKIPVTKTITLREPNQLIATIRPKAVYFPGTWTVDSGVDNANLINGNEYDESYEIRLSNTSLTQYANFSSFQIAINNAFSNFIDPTTNRKIFNGSQIITTVIGRDYNISLNLIINKKLLSNNYKISFKDPKVDSDPSTLIDDGSNSWYANFFMSNLMSEMPPTTVINDLDNVFDLSQNIPTTGTTVIRDITTNYPIYTLDPINNIYLQGRRPMYAVNNIDIYTGINDTINIIAYEDGVETPTNANNITITVAPNKYSRDTLVIALNQAFTNAIASSSLVDMSGSSVILQSYNDSDYLKFVFNLRRQYTTRDFDLVFFDNESFASCTSGASSVSNTTWDTTIGWIMGFRNYTLYDINAVGSLVSGTTNVYRIEGDTGLSTNLYNYFLICLDDFNQNRINDGLVTITSVDTSVPLPSYANRSDFFCDPVTGKKTYNVTTGLTQNQIYAAQAIEDNKGTTESIGTSVSTKSYGTGPFVTDVFGLIPLKLSGIENGQVIIGDSGSVPTQERKYFGPVNIQRMTVRLITDKGNLVDLNKANWSLSLVAEQLNKLEAPENPTNKKEPQID